MGNCINHTQCPECVKIGKDRSGNNLAVYSDGSVYCFSCGYFRSVQGKKHVKADNGLQQQRLFLPSDVVDTIPQRKLKTFIEKYGLGEEDAKQHHLMWSDHYQRIYFPIYTDTGLIAYLGRYCGNDPTKTKWYTQGDLKNIIHILGKSWSDTLVITEDIISAIRVSHAGVRAMPIFGSHIPNLLWLRLKHIPNVHRIILWLDKDKQKEAIKYAYAGRQLGLPVEVVITDTDPKAHNEEQIKLLLDSK